MELGIKFGSNTESISGNFWDNKYNTGICGGFWTRMHKNKVGGRVEILVSTFQINSGTLKDSAGNPYPAISDTSGNKGNFRALYIDIPVMFEYSVLPRLLLQAGIQYSHLVSLHNLTNISGNWQNFFKSGEFAALVGLEVKLPANFSVGARYRYGFGNLDNEEVSLFHDTWKTTAIQFFVGYKIK